VVTAEPATPQAATTPPAEVLATPGAPATTSPAAEAATPVAATAPAAPAEAETEAAPPEAVAEPVAPEPVAAEPMAPGPIAAEAVAAVAAAGTAADAGEAVTPAPDRARDHRDPSPQPPPPAGAGTTLDAPAEDIPAGLPDLATPRNGQPVLPAGDEVAHTPGPRVDAPVAAMAATAAFDPLERDGDGDAPVPHPSALAGAAAAGARRVAAGAQALKSGGWRAKRQQLALAPVRLGTLSPRQLDRHADAINLRRIGKLEPGFKTWRRLWSLVVLIVIVAVIAVAVAAVLDLIVTALSVAANHAISKSAGQ
jgi:hypothetical protein